MLRQQTFSSNVVFLVMLSTHKESKHVGQSEEKMGHQASAVLLPHHSIQPLVEQSKHASYAGYGAVLERSQRA